MFTVGSHYKLTFHGTEGEFWSVYGEVLEYNHPLVRVRDKDGASEVVYNTSAPGFASAMLWEVSSKR